ncbi:MAG: hemolysin [Bacteroidetes bacterium RIFOXYA12_FULL_35_11]|nr:MAG: hemolysin [Bacteroidetes bacterium GWF2_35_48]OFY72458.1 MAG: hemolysin [Bacteroidetes bacterium RIFOXYA12_FULL_35_11]OFY94177.1 MAG: hemolysin [Bacteroidetes bacterium RIFOXYC12_FULL_35_7]OFY97421.1 MAG: hemolysin [Bacteroidetes bacterium RIFOXYB2_FULL_35_7]HBX50491.1 hemolysin [Bacteroidales bacterium]
MKDIIPPVSKDILEKELTKDKFVKTTNFGGNEIYIVTYHDSPNVLNEIGRLREISFRDAGGGTGKEIDLDDYDVCENCYKQLVVWSPKDRELLGGYRYIHCKEAIDTSGKVNIATASLFNFSDKFILDYLPYTIELGRSFVQPAYQSTAASRKGLFALDNLWDGLGALVVKHPDVKYFFGKVTMYRNYNPEARNFLLYFLHKYFSDKEKLVTPLEPIPINIDIQEMERVFTGTGYLEDYKVLALKVKLFGENIPPLINAYMNLSPTMKAFGTVQNHHFGSVEETGILVTISDIYDSKKNRHIGGGV